MKMKTKFKVLNISLLFILLFLYQNCAPFNAGVSFSGSTDGPTPVPAAPVTAFSLSCSASDPRVPTENSLLPLNKFELENTLVDLFEPYLDNTQRTQFLNAIRPLMSAIPKNTVAVGMDLANDDVTAIHVERHYLLGEGVADYISSQASILNRMLGACSGTRTTVACQTSFINSFGLRALRREVDADSRAYYLSVMQGHQDSYRNIIVAMLSSPFFYYHNQFGDSVAGNSTIQLDAYERANKLSYFLLQSMPDDELFAAAANGSILNQTVYTAQVERLLTSPKVRARLTRFFANQWLHLDNTAIANTNIPEVQTLMSEINNPNPSDLRTSLINEVYDYFDHMIWVERADYKDLMSSTLVFPRTQALASIYGTSIWNGQSDSQSLVRAPASQRAGLFTRAQFLYTGSGSTRPIMRGVHVYRDFMCKNLNLPTDNSSPQGVVIQDTMTDQEITRATTEVTGTSCVGCHRSIINPLGFTFDNFDSFGKFRNNVRVFHKPGTPLQGQLLTTKPVDARKDINLNPFLSSTINGAVELGLNFSNNPNAQACFSSRLWNFAQKSNLEVEDNSCAVMSIYESLNSTNGSIIEALKAIVTQPEFTKRRIK